jgi:hypothetical protein
MDRVASQADAKDWGWALSSDQAHGLSGERIIKGLDYVALATDSCNGAVGPEWAAG